MGSEELLLEAGKSGELTAALHTLSEAEYDGEPKYSPMICREIGKLIVCRTYATPVMELVHLIVAASELSLQKGRYEYLFWDSGVARPSNFHSFCAQAFENYDGDLVHLEKGGVKLSYPDGEFTIQYSRMPVLSGLMEFMLTALGYIEIDLPLQELLNSNPSRKSVSECANTISRVIYAYLKDHLPAAQSQRKFRKVLGYCEEDIDAIDDGLILNFWQDASNDADKNVDFKTFDSVVSTFIRAIQAIESARDLAAMRHAGSIGGDQEAGEVSPDLISETLESIEEPLSPLIKLADTPLNQVKFLNKQESSYLERLLTAGDLALRLPLSVLRSDTFSKSQARITQALRRKANSIELSEIIAEEPEETYQDRQVSFQSLKGHVQRCVYASLHALAQARRKDAISILLKLEPGIDYAPLAQHLIDHAEQADNVVTLHGGPIADHFMNLLENEEQIGADLAKVMSDAHHAYANLSRKGFKEDVSQNSDLADAFSFGAEILMDIANDIEAYLERLDSLPLAGGGWQSQYSYDRTIFSGQFSKIYGGA